MTDIEIISELLRSPDPEFTCADCGIPLPWTKEQGERLMAAKGQTYLQCAACESGSKKQD